MKKAFVGVALALALLGPMFAQAQQAAAANAATVVPAQIKFSGTLTDLNGKPITGITGVTFLLYQDEQGGTPLWLETQNITPDKNGHYTVVLGSTTSQGLPTDLFASGEARWLGVQAQGEAEQPRVLLLSVPYALKAGDAQTLGGLPASAFVLAAPPNAATASASASPASTTAPAVTPLASSDVTTTGGTANTIPMFTTATNVQNSILTQTGTTAINVAGKLNLPATGTATTTAGKNSQPQDYVASSYNSSSSAAVAQTFQLQAEPASNDTTTPLGTLNLLYGSGTATPTETGLKINNKGILTFASGQTFPIPNADVTNAMLAHPSLTVKAGTDLTGGGAVSLGGTTTLNLDTTKVPQLGSTNTFSAAQTINGPSSAVALTVDTSGGSGDPQVEIVQNNTTDFARLRLTDSGSTNYWDVAGTVTTSGNGPQLNFWNGGVGVNVLQLFRPISRPMRRCLCPVQPLPPATIPTRL